MRVDKGKWLAVFEAATDAFADCLEVELIGCSLQRLLIGAGWGVVYTWNDARPGYIKTCTCTFLDVETELETVPLRHIIAFHLRQAIGGRVGLQKPRRFNR